MQAQLRGKGTVRGSSKENPRYFNSVESGNNIDSRLWPILRTAKKKKVTRVGYRIEVGSILVRKNGLQGPISS
jgi:hypothetical protein